MLHTGDLAGSSGSGNVLNEDKLKAYLAACSPSIVVHSIKQFVHGQSNPTYLLASEAAKYVLRKKPPGRVLASAHAVEREFAIMSALSQSKVPVPRTRSFCEDVDVIGTPFYVMDFVNGHIFTDPSLPGQLPNARREVYGAFASTLATLHTIDPAEVGLQNFGPSKGYCQRQVRRWSRQYMASVVHTGGPQSEVLTLSDWLSDNIPASNADGSVRLSHGDYRLDNLVYDEQNPGRVLAVLDWELSTLGDPVADLAYACLPYHLPQGIPTLPSLPADLPEGVPTQQEFISMYAVAAGIPVPEEKEMAYYVALAMFRIAAILAGVGARAAQGNASSAVAHKVGSRDVISSIAKRALCIVGDAIHMALPEPASNQLPAPPRLPATRGSPSIPRQNSTSLRQQGVSGYVNPRGWSSNLPKEAIHAVSQHNSSTCRCRTQGKHGDHCDRCSGGVSYHDTSPDSCHVKGGSMKSNVGAATVRREGTAATSPHISPASSNSSSATGLGPSPRAQQLLQRLQTFMEQHIEPADHVLHSFHDDRLNPDRWQLHPLRAKLRAEARAQGLWNLWMPQLLAEELATLQQACDRQLALGAGLTNLEYAHLCEVMGRIPWASEVFNCNAPDTGNMEVLAKYGTLEQQKRWLVPLLQGDCASCFAMTEPAVASSDATNIRSSVVDAGGGMLRLNGRKWWTTGACSPACQLAIFMGKTDPSAPTHRQQSMVLVPMDAKGVKVIRPLDVFGYDAAPHGHAEVSFDDVVVPESNLLLGRGRGFEIAQGRLGPGRLHHCMRIVGLGERGMELMTARASQRVAFGKAVSQQGAFVKELAQHRVHLDAARLTVLAAADALDRFGNKSARHQIAAAKVLAPTVVLAILDAAIQVYGGAGVCGDTPLAHLYAEARTLRIADGPDDVHYASIGRAEVQKAAQLDQQRSKL